MDRSASSSASRWTPSMSLSSSCSVMGASGLRRSWLWLVVKPFTSSPAMPMMTWVGWMPAVASASRSAERQFSTTPRMSVTVAACMWPRPWRVRPVPVTMPCAVLDAEDERLDVLGADVQRGRHRRRLAVVAAPDPAQDGHRSARPADRGQARQRRCASIAASASGMPAWRVPLPWAIDGRPPPRPSMAGIAAWTSSAAETPRGHDVIADRDPDLRHLVVHARAR